MKGWAAGLALKKRPKIIRKWSINNLIVISQLMRQHSRHRHILWQPITLIQKKQGHCEDLGGSGDFSRAHSIATNYLKLTC